VADFLFEIGLEEVPARMIAGAEAELLRRVLALLGKEALLPESFDALADARSYSTPRRLAVWVRGVRTEQSDVTEEVIGPAAKIAFKEGVATPAAKAFARKNGVAVSELRTVETPKGAYLAATSVKKGRSAADVLAEALPKELAAIYWAKTMYWRAGKPERFVRPVLWMVCLLQEDSEKPESVAVVPVAFGGRVAARASFGHRVLSSGEAFEVQTPASYAAQLEGEYVIADVEARRHKIRKALDRATRTVPASSAEAARWREDEALVDAVTHLTEWPEVLLGGFEAEYLALPEEVLVTVMRDHQKYFAVEDASGKLAPHFLAVLNIATDERSAAIIRQGNERVLRARFNDAKFFWEFDQRTPLVERVKLLENVTFQKDLGSYAAKTERVRALAAKLAEVARSNGASVDVKALDDAAQLAKADLTTELVKEFTELQGKIGGLYARAQGVSQIACDAIYDQYTPAGMDDGVPRSIDGALLGIADRADTIAGMFGLGLEPTGSKDPFALRRAANGIVKILAETAPPLTLDVLIALAAKDEATSGKLRAFFRERVEFYLREVRGQAYDVAAAVMAVSFEDVRDTIARAEAVSAVRGGADFAAVSAAFKRIRNILSQAKFELDGDAGLALADFAGREDAEGRLAKKAFAVAEDVQKLRAAHNYVRALEMVATLRPEVDAFFAEVMVMDPDLQVREGRLRLLALVERSFSGIAEFAEIVAG
jgi:glycyl-tRNA synthetase beta chain